MIYLINNITSTIIGAFDNIYLAKKYLNEIGITDHSDYIYLRRIEDMTYISKICYVDGVCIYNNKDFWLNQSQDIFLTYASHSVIDFLNTPVTIDRFQIEMNQNTQRISNVYNSADEVFYNMHIGTEFISLFREECITTDLGTQSGMGIAISTKDVIPLVITGSFKEATVAVSAIPNDDFFTPDRLNKYINCLSNADIITYL